MAQRLRGALLSPRELWRPKAWRDWVGCVGLPLTVRAIRMAEEAALAEVARGFLRDHFHEGANPGLCVCAANTVPDVLVALGRRAQRDVLRLRRDGAEWVPAERRKKQS